jgi:3-hydroxymyristoyl/3-hydroxydecanoyl-(acyl carrier protein) dehydratase
VEPGDQLVLTATLERAMKGIWKFSTTALVDGVEVCHAEMMVAPEAGSGASKATAAVTAGATS